MLVYTNTAYRPLSRNRKKLPKKASQSQACVEALCS
jgi:hypothetical protein